MFTLPLYKDNVMVTSWSDASSYRMKENMAELMQQMRDPATIGGGSVGSIPQSIVSSSANPNDLQKALRNQGIHSTPASNLKLSEQMRHAQHDSSPIQAYQQHHLQQQQQQQHAGQQNGVPNRLAISKSYSGGLNHSGAGSGGGGGGNVPTGNSSISSSLSSLPDISANNSQFFEVLYVGKIKVSHKRVPCSFIDDALPKFKAYDAEKLRQQHEASRKQSTSVTPETDATESRRKPESKDRGTESTPPPSTDDPPEVFQGRRVSQFDIPAKKIENDSNVASTDNGAKEEPTHVGEGEQQRSQQRTGSADAKESKDCKSASPQDEE